MMQVRESPTRSEEQTNALLQQFVKVLGSHESRNRSSRSWFIWEKRDHGRVAKKASGTSTFANIQITNSAG
jgi:hypothetical protein